MLSSLQNLAQQCTRATGASTTAVGLVRDGELRTVAVSGVLSAQLSPRTRLQDSLVAHCLRTGIPQIRLEPFPGQPLSGIQSLIYFPIIAEGKTRGVLAVFADRPDAFSVRDLRVAEIFARGICRILGWREKPHPVAQIAPPATREQTIVVAEPKEATASFVPEFRQLDSGRQSGRRSKLAWAVGTVGMLLLTGASLFVAWQRWNPATSASYPVPPTSTQQPPRPVPAPSDSAPLATTAGKAEGAATPAVSEKPKAAPKVEHKLVDRAAAAPMPGITLNEVTARNEGTHDFIVFRFNGATPFKAGRLKSPDRIFIDFPLAGAASSAYETPETMNVQQVRVGYDAPRGTRIVLDLHHRSDFLIVRSADGESIVLDVYPAPPASQ